MSDVKVIKTSLFVLQMFFHNWKISSSTADDWTSIFATALIPFLIFLYYQNVRCFLFLNKKKAELSSAFRRKRTFNLEQNSSFSSDPHEVLLVNAEFCTMYGQESNLSVRGLESPSTPLDDRHPIK